MIGNPLSLTLFNPGLGALLPELFHLPTRDFPAEGFAMTSSYPVNLRQVFYNYSGGTFSRETLTWTSQNQKEGTQRGTEKTRRYTEF